MEQHSTVDLPEFHFTPPEGYHWLTARSLVGFTSFSQLQPWYFLDKVSTFSLKEVWPQDTLDDGELVAFARRQDNDDIACFRVIGQTVASVVTVHGWTSTGYTVIDSHNSIWDWLKTVIDDISNWVHKGS